MTYSINQFTSQGLVLGGARPTLFEVIIPNFPLLQNAAAIASGDLTSSSKLSLMAKAASLPPSIVQEINVGYMGRKIKVAGDRTFPNWSITVYNDEDFAMRNLFEDWHEILNSRQPNLMSRATPASGQSHGSTDPQNYKRDITVIQYSKAGAIKKFYTLIGAIPVTVSAIDLDYDSTNQIEMFQVEFAYDYWEPNDNSGGISDGPTPSRTENPGS